jgi:hypothetical protein
MSTEKPVILELKAITPTPQSSRNGRLEYGNLTDIVETQRPYEIARMNDFWDAEPDSLEELKVAQALARQYMLMGSLALQRAGTVEAKTTWSDRYTQATSEIYGTPEAAMARQLWDGQEQGGAIDMGPEVERVSAQLKAHLEQKYSSVYEALERDLPETPLSAAEIADRFEAALAVLASEYDVAWGEWSIDRNEEKDSLSISGADKTIIVGMHRARMKPENLRGLFSHELLVHALRSVNGWKTSEELGKGLSGYLDLEEGLGTFVEYAINGEVSQKNVDRYVDIAYALGQIDGKQHSRAELLAHAMQRANRRNEESGSKTDPEDLEKEVYAHVNRIYRGSLGDEHIGIYTKDMMYLKGFLDIAEYFSGEVEGGETIEQVMDYLMIGKFDPTNQAHAEYVASVKTA